MDPNTETDPESQEIKTIFEEALTCTACRPPTPPSPTPTEYLSNNDDNIDNSEDVPVSPHSTRPAPNRTGYIRLMTDDQRRRYIAQVLSHVDAGLEALREAGAERGERERDEVLMKAFWRVENHISLHYRVGSGVLGFCRDERDLGELEGWLRGVTGGGFEGGDGHGDGNGRKRERGSGTGFPGCRENQEMLDMVDIWRGRWRERKERVERAGGRWMSSTEETEDNDGCNMDN